MTALPRVFQPFDVLGPLPQGTTVLEASAGTGKTFTIAALVGCAILCAMTVGAPTRVTFSGMFVSDLLSQMLKVATEDRYIAAIGQTQGVPLPVTWVDIANPTPSAAAAKFSITSRACSKARSSTPLSATKAVLPPIYQTTHRRST